MRRRYLYGVMELFLGFLLILLGIFTFINPSSALHSFTYFYGIIAIVSGIISIIFYIAMERRTGFGPMFYVISGVLDILLGIVLMTNIWAGWFAVAFMMPFWFIFLCVSRLCQLGFIRLYAGTGGFLLTLIINLAGLILGFYLLLNPIVSLLTLTYLIGFYLLSSGLEVIIYAAGHLKKKKHFLEY